jgi:hypothetical protein
LIDKVRIAAFPAFRLGVSVSYLASALLRSVKTEQLFELSHGFVVGELLVIELEANLHAFGLANVVSLR